MGADWDSTGVAFDSETWRACLRVLKPGGHLLAFGGTRTHHRMMVALEDAGFELRDMLCWVYGSGFPKSHDISKAFDKLAGAKREVIGIARGNQGGGAKTFDDDAFTWPKTHNVTTPATDLARQWDGWGTALKPAWEPIVLARKPISEKSVAANVAVYGTGGLNIDACRIGLVGRETPTGSGNGTVANRRTRSGGDSPGNGGNNTPVEGRWPANLLLDEESAALLDEQGGERTSGSLKGTYKGGGTMGIYGAYGVAEKNYDASSGGASRFFYTAKASRAERGPGNDHPTVKPIALMRYLCKLITPPGGTVLDPFCGSGSTGVAADREGFNFVGIEQNPHYAEIARLRITGDSPMFAEVDAA